MTLHLLKSFLHSKLPQMGLLLLFLLIFGGVAALYHLPAEPVLYSTLLCGVVALLFFSGQFHAFQRRHHTLQQIARQLTADLSAELPASASLLEQDYQHLVSMLQQQIQQFSTQWATERSQSMDYYAAWVHQIKTPITVMRMLLQEDDTPANGMLLNQLFSIEQYVDMALCYTRLDSDSSDFVIQRCPLDGIIRQTVRKYAAQFIHQKIQLHYDGTDALVLTDEKWLAFLLEQILSNALKYTRQGSITIAYHQGTLQIADTGIGIAPEDLPRIFEKGFTGYNGRAQKKATGLGLYLCRRIAGKLNCTLRVDSIVGQGTTFYIDFPDQTVLL